jgi:hypothetical protein
MNPRTKTGDCTCGHRLPDLLIGASGKQPPQIVMICPECGEQWELGLTKATRASMAKALGIKKRRAALGIKKRRASS